MTRFPHRIVLTAALVFASALMAHAQNRLETPKELNQGFRDHENVVAVELERLRMEREFQHTKESEFDALNEAARKAIVDPEFAATWEKTSGWKLASNDDFLPKALANFRLDFSGSKAVVKTTQEKLVARVGVGELLPVEHTDVSSYFLEVTDVNADAKTIRLAVGDVVYTLHADGKVDAPTTQELLARLKEKLGAYKVDGAAHSYVVAKPKLADILPILKHNAQIPIRQSHLIVDKNFEYRVTARPLEFVLTMLCLAYGEDGGRTIVWEKSDAGYYLRPFPIGERVFDHSLPKMEVKSIAEDSMSAVLVMDGKESTIAPLDFVPIPLGGKTYIDAIAGSISAKWHEVVIDAGGSRIVVATLPAELAAKPITAKTREQIRVRMLCNYLSSLAGVKIIPGSVIMETGMFVGNNTPFGEVWKNFLADHEWKYRWVGANEILLDYPEYLTAPEVEKQRQSAK